MLSAQDSYSSSDFEKNSKDTLSDDWPTPTTCTVCNELFNDARILPCFHTFCLSCVIEQNKNATGKLSLNQVKCPTCSAPVAVPSGGIIKLRRNFTMNAQVEKEKLLSKLSSMNDTNTAQTSSIPMMCGFEQCSTNPKPASVYCTVCRTALCDQCIMGHHKMTSGKRSHNLESLHLNGGLTVVDVDRLVVEYCDSHKLELNRYCWDCNLAVCNDCFINQHNGHNQCELSSDLLITFRRQLQSEIDRTKIILATDLKHRGMLHHARQKTSDNAERVRKDIIKFSEEVKQRVEREKNELLERVGSLITMGLVIG